MAVVVSEQNKSAIASLLHLEKDKLPENYFTDTQHAIREVQDRLSEG